MKFISSLSVVLLTGLSVLSPESWAADQADPHPGTVTIPVTGTLPVIYINTVDNQVIDQKETYIDASLWIEAPANSGYESVGSAEKPLALGIRGRGNASWEFDKKPYKIKLDKKNALLGLSKSKHFALLNHAPSQGSLIENVSFELARRIGLDWTPREIPVEVMLNGHNVGLYYLTETVRIESERVNIYEQPDQNTDEATIDGGWLIEIDNYEDPCQVKIMQNTSGEAFEARFTYHTPEDLSDLQEEWLTNEMTTLTNLIYNPDKTDNAWEEKIDIESLAKYYIVQELTDNRDAFFSSTYFYKDLDSKWKFGPMWDSGWTFEQSPRTSTFVEDRAEICEYCPFVWIEELWKFPHFRQYVCQTWKQVYPALTEGMSDHIDKFLDLIEPAFNRNYDEIWHGEYYSIGQMRDIYKSRMEDNTRWMDNFINATLDAAIGDIEADSFGETITVIPSANGTFTVKGASAPLVAVTVTGLDGRAGAATVTGADTFVFDAVPGLYILSATTSAGRTLPVKFTVR